MSTRCIINLILTVEIDDNIFYDLIFKSLYFNHDGYPEGVGVTIMRACLNEKYIDVISNIKGIKEIPARDVGYGEEYIYNIYCNENGPLIQIKEI